MISLPALDQSPIEGVQTIGQLADEILHQILACADFHRYKNEINGDRTPYFIMRKALPGPAGRQGSAAPGTARAPARTRREMKTAVTLIRRFAWFVGAFAAAIWRVVIVGR